MGASVSKHEMYSTVSTYGPPRQAHTALSVVSPPKRGQAFILPPNKGQAVSPPKTGQVIAFYSSAKWRNYFEATKQTSKLVVVDFTAAWCKPCQIIQPAFNEFAEKYTDVEFVKIDVDQLVDVAAGFGVHVMPTFILLQRGKEVDKVVGVKKDELQKKIEKYRF